MRLVLTCEGDAAYKKRVKVLAARRGMTMSEMVRHALDHTYGEELNAPISHVVPSDHFSGQSKTKKTKKQ